MEVMVNIPKMDDMQKEIDRLESILLINEICPKCTFNLEHSQPAYNQIIGDQWECKKCGYRYWAATNLVTQIV